MPTTALRAKQPKQLLPGAPWQCAPQVSMLKQAMWAHFRIRFGRVATQWLAKAMHLAMPWRPDQAHRSHQVMATPPAQHRPHEQNSRRGPRVMASPLQVVVQSQAWSGFGVGLQV